MKALGFTKEEIERETDQERDAQGQAQEDDFSRAEADAQVGLGIEDAQAPQSGEQRGRGEITGREAESQPVAQVEVAGGRQAPRDLFGGVPAQEQSLADARRRVVGELDVKRC